MSENDPDTGAAAADPHDGAPKRRPLWLAFLAALVVLLSMIGLYARQSREAEALDAPSSPGGLFREDQARGTSLTSVGRLTGMSQPCTAWLLDAGAPGTTPAYAVTSGRCAGVEDSASVLSGVPVTDARIEFNTFAALTTAERSESVPAAVEEVVWASARGTDLAILRLGSSYSELAGKGVAGISPTAMLDEGGQILIAGVPVKGIAADETHLRGSRCAIGATSDVAEQPWLWSAMGAVDCGGMLEGSAGSPAFNPAGQAIGMMTTTTIGAPAGSDCSTGRPCEVTTGSVSFSPDTSYLVSVDALSACFPEGTFTLGGDCALEDPDSVVAASLGSSSAQAGADLPVRIGADPGDVVGTRAAMLDGGDCWDKAGWQVAAVSLAGTVTVTAPSRQGLALVCVGSASQPTPLFVTIAGTAPDAGAIELDQVPVEGGVQVRPVADPPDYSTFRWVVGPAGTTDCAIAEGYTEFTGEAALIEAADLPAVVCVIAYDEAGTPSAPSAFTVE